MKAPQILYIEDNRDNFTLVKRVLEVEGYEVIEAPTGRNGLQKAGELLPDLIITDINLPDIDGYDITLRLKENPKTAHIPVVAMTANVMKKDRDFVQKAGCQGFIAKPIDIDALPLQIENFLRGDL